MKFTVKLSACGNPDFRQGRYLPGVRAKRVKVPSFAWASKVRRAYIQLHELGAGNWNGGQVYEGNVQVAQVSYNGRVWTPDGKPLEEK